MPDWVEMDDLSLVDRPEDDGEVNHGSRADDPVECTRGDVSAGGTTSTAFRRRLTVGSLVACTATSLL